ncbi:MAG: hypothetical protein HQL80_04760 [Magnetococcales bacterium]|nr:hypothetical protein [Magnetococcales bacterium]
MFSWWDNLSVKWKLILGFSMVGLLFLGVVWRYQSGMLALEQNYERMMENSVPQKELALEIASAMLQARRAEKDFLLRMDSSQEEKVAKQVALVQELTQGLTTVAGKENDADLLRNTATIRENIGTYGKAFAGLAAAWKQKGLTPDTGLRGTFRDAAHHLEAQLKEFDVDGLRTLLLEARRAEKDLRLRRDAKYGNRHHEVMKAFVQLLDQSLLGETTKKKYWV